MALAINWQTEAVEAAGYSTWPSLAFSPAGQPAIAYHSSDNHALRFAEKQVDGSWSISTVDTVFGNCSPSLAFRFGQPAISYSGPITGAGKDAVSELRYAIRRGSPGWTIETVAPGWNESSLAIGPSHQPGISYADRVSNSLLFTRSKTPSTWVGKIADPDNVGGWNALAFTPSGQPAIAYLADLIKYAEFTGSQWKREEVGAGDGWVSLAFTPAGEPAICYVREMQMRQPAVIHAVRRGGTWNREWIADGHTPWLGFSPAGEPAISYVQALSESVIFALFFDRTWHHFTVEQPNRPPTGGFIGPFIFTSLAFSPVSGQPAISYFDYDDGAIRYAIGTVYEQGMLTALFSFIRDLLRRIRRYGGFRRTGTYNLPN